MFRTLLNYFKTTPEDKVRKLLRKAKRNNWDRFSEEEAEEFVNTMLEAGLIHPSLSRKLRNKLILGETYLRKDGYWACKTCGGNCGQCGDTSFYGNIGFSLQQVGDTFEGRKGLSDGI